MSVKPETKFIQSLHKRLKACGIYCLKNHNVYEGGLPDCFYEGTVGDLWVEYKWFELPKRDNTTFCFADTRKHLSALQQQWIKRRLAKNLACWVIVGSSCGHIIFRDTTWEQVLTRAHFLTHAVSTDDVVNAIAHAVHNKSA